MPKIWAKSVKAWSFSFSPGILKKTIYSEMQFKQAETDLFQLKCSLVTGSFLCMAGTQTMLS